MITSYKSGVLLALFLSFGTISSCKKEEKKAPPPVKVPYVEIMKKDIPIFREYPAQTFGDIDVTLTARVDGTITGIYFKEGSRVKKGQLLYTIDPAEYDAKVNREKGQVAAVESNYINAQEELKRIRPLAEMNAVSKRELDAAIARVEATKSSLSSAKASLKNQEIERGYCNITSPVDGVIGISNARLGDYVSRFGGSSKLNTVSKLDDVRVRFAVSETAFLKYQEIQKQGIHNLTDLELILSDDSTYPYKGKLNFSDASVDPSTGTVTFETQFPNPKGLIRSGQFVKIRLLVYTEKNTITVPQKAVSEMQEIYQVFVVDKSNKIANRVIEVGEKTASDWIVKKGLEPGDKVAIVGNIFIQPGATVIPVPYKAESLN